MKPYILLLLSLSFWGAIRAQSAKQVLEWINTVKADNTNFYYEIPFDYTNGEIVVEVTIGGRPYRYIFDSGGYNDITDEIQSRNNFPVLARETVGSSNGLKAKMNLVKVDSFKIGELVFRNVAALQMNFDGSPTIKCTIDGALIGASMIKNYVWQIDLSRKKIIVTDQLAKVPNLEQAVKIPVSFNSRLMPFIETAIDGHPQKMMVDLGSSTLFMLTEKDASTYTGGKGVIEVEGATSEGGNGVVHTTNRIIKADTVAVGPFAFINKPLVYSESSVVSLIGNPLIKNFILTLNFKDGALYLTPIPQTPLKPGWSSFGLELEYNDGKVVVSAIFKGLAADKAGVRIGDVVTAIDWINTDFSDVCVARASIKTLLESKNGLRFTILREGEVRLIPLLREKVF
jgi:hypothetical protein